MEKSIGATRQMGNEGGGIKRSTHTGTRGILQEPGKLLALRTERPPHLRLLCPHHQMGHDPPKSPLKGHGSSYGKKKVLRGAGGKPSTKITEGRSGRNHGTGGLSGLPTVAR